MHKGSQTELDHGAVEQDLCANVTHLDRVLKVTHQEHVACTVEFSLLCVVEDLAQYHAGLGALVSVLVDQDTCVVEIFTESIVLGCIA